MSERERERMTYGLIRMIAINKFATLPLVFLSALLSAETDLSQFMIKSYKKHAYELKCVYSHKISHRTFQFFKRASPAIRVVHTDKEFSALPVISPYKGILTPYVSSGGMRLS